MLTQETSSLVEKTSISLLSHDTLKKPELFPEITRTLIDSIAVQEPYLDEHSSLVADVSEAIAKAMSLSKKHIQAIHAAGYFHDVGKIFIPNELLSRPCSLNAEEIRIVQSHAEKGAALFEGSDLPEIFILGIAQHHERLDGSGYPYGLSGSDISISGRIVGLADTFVAALTATQYRPASDIKKIMKQIGPDYGIMTTCSNIKYDRDCGAALAKLVNKGSLDMIIERCASTGSKNNQST